MFNINALIPDILIALLLLCRRALRSFCLCLFSFLTDRPPRFPGGFVCRRRPIRRRHRQGDPKNLCAIATKPKPLIRSRDFFFFLFPPLDPRRAPMVLVCRPEVCCSAQQLFDYPDSLPPHWLLPSPPRSLVHVWLQHVHGTPQRAVLPEAGLTAFLNRMEVNPISERAALSKFPV